MQVDAYKGRESQAPYFVELRDDMATASPVRLVPQVVSRRSFLIALSGGMGSTLFSVAARAQDPGTMVATQLFGLALGHAQQFAQGPDGATSMMEAGLALQRLAIEKLVEVRIAIDRVDQKLSELGEEQRATVVEFYVRALTDPILGACNQYRSIADSVAASPNLARSPATFARLSGIKTQVADRRAQLQSMPEACGVEVVPILPVACALECATSYQLARGKKPEFLAAELRDYEAWLARILGSETGSIDGQMRRHLARHDQLVDRAMTSPTSSIQPIIRKRLANLKVGSAVPKWEVGEGCMLFINMGPPGLVPVTGQNLFDGTNNGGASFLPILEISKVPDEEHGIQRLVVRPGSTQVAIVPRNQRDARPNQYQARGTRPAIDDPCTYYSGVGREFSSEAEVVTFAQSQEEWKAIQSQRVHLEALLASLNVERAKVANCVRARASALATQAFVSARRRALEGT